MKLHKPSWPLSRPGNRMSDDVEYVSPWVHIAAAFAGGAAPVLVTYVLSKLDPNAFEVEVNE